MRRVPVSIEPDGLLGDNEFAMKWKSPLLLAALCGWLINPLRAAEWATLSGIGDHLVLTKGETAMVVSASPKVVVHYDKPGAQRVALRVASPDPRRNQAGIHTTATVVRRQPSEVTVSMDRPLPLAGPCRIELRSPGVLTLQIVGRQPPPAR